MAKPSTYWKVSLTRADESARWEGVGKTEAKARKQAEKRAKDAGEDPKQLKASAQQLRGSPRTL